MSLKGGRGIEFWKNFPLVKVCVMHFGGNDEVMKRLLESEEERTGGKKLIFMRIRKTLKNLEDN